MLILLWLKYMYVCVCRGGWWGGNQREREENRDQDRGKANPITRIQCLALKS